MKVKEAGIIFPNGTIMAIHEGMDSDDGVVSSIEIEDDRMTVNTLTGLRKVFPEPKVLWYATTGFAVVDA